MTSPSNNHLRAALLGFFDTLLPGAEAWPSASTALRDPESVTAALDDGDGAWLRRCAAALDDVAPAGRAEALRVLEREEPGPFGRVLSALYAAYYSTEAAQRRVEALADAAPREASAFVDETLLDAVRLTRVGERRM